MYGYQERGVVGRQVLTFPPRTLIHKVQSNGSIAMFDTENLRGVAESRLSNGLLMPDLMGYLGCVQKP